MFLLHNFIEFFLTCLSFYCCHTNKSQSKTIKKKIFQLIFFLNIFYAHSSTFIDLWIRDFVPVHVGIQVCLFKEKFQLLICFPSVFKATYESGIASYKNFYFNATANTLQIWILVVVFIISLYESLKYLIKLCISRQLRYSMAFLFCLSIFSHYYAWWAYTNYLNDDFYSQWNHQTFFTVGFKKNGDFYTHKISFTAYGIFFYGICASFSKQGKYCYASKVSLCQITFFKFTLMINYALNRILVIIGVSILHIFAASFDQFIQNVLLGFGYMHQILRDIGFMIPDILHLILSIILLRKEGLNNRPLHRDKTIRKDLLVMIMLIGISFAICSFL